MVSSVLLCTILAVLQKRNFQMILLATADVLLGICSPHHLDEETADSTG